MFRKGVKQEIDCTKTFLVQFAHYLNLVDRRLSVVKGGCLVVINILLKPECGLECSMWNYCEKKIRQIFESARILKTLLTF